MIPWFTNRCGSYVVITHGITWLLLDTKFTIASVSQFLLSRLDYINYPAADLKPVLGLFKYVCYL